MAGLFTFLSGGAWGAALNKSVAPNELTDAPPLCIVIFHQSE
jgi:hypothetical protein